MIMKHTRFIRSKDMGEDKTESPKKKPKLPPARLPKISQKVQQSYDPPEVKKKPKDSRA